MKKVFTILIAAVLLLSLTGGVVATEVTNVTATPSVETSVTLDLENKYKITIPDAISFKAETITTNQDISVPKYTAESQVKVDITLIGANEKIIVNVSSAQYNSSYIPSGFISGSYGVTGAWKLTNSSGSSELHYIISTGSAHLTVDDLTDDKKHYVLSVSPVDKFIGNKTTIVDDDTHVTVPIHAALVDVPTFVDTYTDTLVFTVKLDDST